MIQERTDVMHEEGVQLLGDLFLVGEIKSSIKWNPDTLQVHGTNLDNMTRLFALQDAIASTSGHACDVQQLCAIDHMVVYKSQSSARTKTTKCWIGLPSRLATHTPFASTWKQRLPSSSQSVAVTRGFMPGGAI
jgi:hypothetical protein